MAQKLSIVIPIFNEAEHLEEILRQIDAVEIGMEKELILVDDCSTDGTREILENLQNSSENTAKIFYHEINRGKGATLRTGFQHITGEITLIQDADLEYDPQDYPKLLEPILTNNADVVYGSRFMAGRQEGLLRSYLANRFLTSLSNLVNGTKLTDMETCYKVIKTDILKDISLCSDRFGFEPEITAKLAKRKCKIVDVPISYRGRDYHEGKTVSWKDGVAAIFHILRFRFFS
ncbi:MAG: glycosyltransferase family 2 protein [Candidatus Poribacteria bacterium]|nr:glycosyltransferase family 2 protein [Candidatus Poribacteria bacterium]MDE0482480.1 glycosyltransferase family 2 protein [Candidatus Poribacteria bacterium]